MSRSAYLWCPAYPLADMAQQERAIGAAQLFAEACGLRLEVSPLLGRRTGCGAWLPADERRADLEQGFRHDLLLAARGGYGCLDLLETLAGYDGAPPPVMGYSDLTILHGLWRRRGWRSGWYGFMPGVTPGGRAMASAIACVAGDTLVLDHGTDPGVTVVRPGRAEGPLVPACLRVLAGLAGTPAMPDLAGCILALEDIDERPYRMDRDLMQLYLSGCLRGVAGLVLGRFPCADLPADYQGPSVRDIARRWADRLAVPSVASLPFGHETDPVTLPCGRMATLSADGDLWRLKAG
jgi:muramoyltetrapeptide carboxypeptidase